MQKLHISIPEPCHENWHAMTPTQQGRFCNACTKEVVDFSMMTDTEILNYFTSVTHEKVCGRALPSQLDRTITRPKDPKKRLFWYWNYIVMFFMFFSKANAVKAQGGVKRVTVTEISNAPACKVGEPVKSSSRVISGKVTDIDGNPVSFATIKIKALPTALSADANGEYSIKVNPNDKLLISSAGFQATEVVIGTHSIINVILDRKFSSELIEIVVAAGTGLDDSKRIAVLAVRDDKSGLPINNAKIIILKRGNNYVDTFFADKKGEYKLKGLKENEEYFIKVEAGGYGVSEFTIAGENFRDKKKVWEVLLTPKEVELPAIERALSAKAKLGTETIVRLGQVNTVFSTVAAGALYVVDGIIMPNTTDIHPDDVEDITILQAPKAMALFGAVGSNGAIVITTRKPKVKDLDTVVVSSKYLNKAALSGSMGGVYLRTKVSKYADIKARIITRLTDSLKIYPNPVQKGTTFSVSMKLKQAGAYSIQITDATGRIVLQKQTNIPTKEYREKLQTDSRWGSGIYFIRVFDNNNKPINKASFIVL